MFNGFEIQFSQSAVNDGTLEFEQFGFCIWVWSGSSEKGDQHLISVIERSSLTFETAALDRFCSILMEL